MHPFCDLTGSLPDRENVLPALRAAQIELVDRVKILGGISIELAWKTFKNLFDRGGIHRSREGRVSQNWRREPRCRGPRSVPSNEA